MENVTKPTRRTADTILIVLFVVAILLPGVGRLFRLDTLTGGEMRKPTPVPAMTSTWQSLKVVFEAAVRGKIDVLEIKSAWGSFWAYPKKLTAYYANHFGFRNDLIRLHALSLHYALGVSPSSKVIVGKDHWLYYADDNCLDDFHRTSLLTEEELKAWRDTLVVRRDWFAARGMKFLLVFAPDKYVINPENLPDAYHHANEPYRFEQLANYLQAHSDLEIVNLRAALEQAKTKERIWHRTDSHWNDRGALVGYQQIIGRLTPWFPSVKPLARDDFDAATETTPGWDLPAMMQLTDVIHEENLYLIPRTPRRAKLINLTNPDARWNEALMIFERSDDPSLPKAVVLRDSFFSALTPFVAEHFRRVAIYWQTDLNVNLKLVMDEHPNVVIQEIAGRKLFQSTPGNPEEIVGGK